MLAKVQTAKIGEGGGENGGRLLPSLLYCSALPSSRTKPDSQSSLSLLSLLIVVDGNGGNFSALENKAEKEGAACSLLLRITAIQPLTPPSSPPIYSMYTGGPRGAAADAGSK
jgi:hypothetical protein